MKTNRRGFTLIELLVAITMVSLLSLAGLYAMRAGFSTLDRTGRALAFERRVTSSQRILEQMIANLMPARALCHGGEIDLARREARAGRNIGFFEGRSNQMRFVSTFSLEEAARGAPRIIELAVIPGDKNQGVRLIVNEHVYWGPLSTGFFCSPAAGGLPTESPFPPVQSTPRSFILADRQASVHFLFRNRLPAPPYFEWLENWPVFAPPQAIRIDSDPLPGSDGRPLHLTLPVHLTRVWSGLTKYTDTLPLPEFLP